MSNDLLQELENRKKIKEVPQVEFVEEVIEEEGGESIVPPNPIMSDDPAPEEPVEAPIESGSGAVMSEALPEISINRDLFIKILEWTIDQQIDKTQVELVADKVGALVEERQKILTLADLNDVTAIPEIQEKVVKPEEAGEPPKEKEKQLPFREGATATNPTTGEKVIFLSGKWESYEPSDERK